MSAPQTNLEKQQRRHWGPLAGIGLALTVAVVAAVFFFSAPAVPNDAADPDGSPAAVEAMADDMQATEQNIDVDQAEEAARALEAEQAADAED